jgi:hypothetical protein
MAPRGSASPDRSGSGLEGRLRGHTAAGPAWSAPASGAPPAPSPHFAPSPHAPRPSPPRPPAHLPCSFSSMELQVLLNHFSAHTDCGDDKLCRETFFSSLSQGEAPHAAARPPGCAQSHAENAAARLWAWAWAWSPPVRGRRGVGQRPASAWRKRAHSQAAAARNGGPCARCRPRPHRRRRRRRHAAFGGLEPRLLQHIYTAMDENGRGWVSFRQVWRWGVGRGCLGVGRGLPVFARARPWHPRL